ncbi:hypothetical protein HPSD74_0411 [Glaesserella parasuis D74]|nr:hypothetical protein HPSD74_0411 [Glaesserella parasuis D74]
MCKLVFHHFLLSNKRSDSFGFFAKYYNEVTACNYNLTFLQNLF